MFSNLPMAPPDAILGLSEAFERDPNPAKINLSVGVYKDAQGRTPILSTVKKAEERLVREESTKGYLSISGAPQYARAVQQLLFPAGHEVLASERIATAQTPGGTGGLRVAADFLKQMFPGTTVWLSQPTWPNHPNIFAAAGLPVKTYPYFDKATNGIAWQAMLDTLQQIPAGDVLLLHGCCHNPTGADPTPDQWQTIAQVTRERGILPLVDFAYQGFGSGLREDAVGLEALAQPGSELLVCSSFSKNFGLYRERVGAISVIGESDDAAARALSQIKSAIRANYSNPPAHGAAVVTTILTDPELRSQWEQELADMRARINGMRELFVQTLADKGVPGDFSFIRHQKGMFSFSGLTKEQVHTLRDRYAIYIVDSGRINVAGMTEANMDQLCTAIKEVVTA